jgi:hypothetical protein
MRENKMISLYKKEKLYDDISSSCKKFLEEFGCDEVLVDETTQAVKIRKNSFHEDNELITSLSDKEDPEKRLAFSMGLDYLQALHYCELYKNHKLMWFMDDHFISTLQDKLSCCQIVAQYNNLISIRFPYTYPGKDTPVPIQMDIYNKDIIQELLSMDNITIEKLYGYYRKSLTVFKPNERIITRFDGWSDPKRWVGSLIERQEILVTNVIWNGPHYIAYIYNENGDMGRGKIPKIISKHKDHQIKRAKSIIEHRIKEDEKEIEILKAILDANP